MADDGGEFSEARELEVGMRRKLRATMSEMWELTLHIFFGLFNFLLIASAAYAVHVMRTQAAANGLDPIVVNCLHYVEIVMVLVDCSLLIIFLIRTLQIKITEWRREP
ncbi:MAG: hypothetical protein KDI60_09025 [Xanthomonadales bacterium]|nr:hypothetical protein [Xanthomonadales bacterium]